MLLKIEKLVYGGDGLARLPADERGPGKVVFVPFVLKGETVEALPIEEKRGFARTQLEHVVEASPLRIEPACPYFTRCGGCHYQHVSYRHQLEIKSRIVTENLRRIAKVELDGEPILHSSPEWNYRNRTRLKIRSTPEFAIGYHKANSNELLPVERCPISSPLINKAIAALWQAGRSKALDSSVNEIELFANAEDTELLIELYCSGPLTNQQAAEIADSFNKALPSTVGVSVFESVRVGDPKPLAAVGAGNLTYRTRSGDYRVSAGSFFQINRSLIDELIQIVTEGASGELALDLYAGVGLFSSVLARSFAQVIAVESSPTSYQDLFYNSPRNVKTVGSTTEQFLRTAGKTLRPNLIVVDPPRNGLGEMVVRSLAGLGASRIIYVSCDPATASRDLAGLLSSGYRIQQAHVVDLFPQTFHIESVWDLGLKK